MEKPSKWESGKSVFAHGKQWTLNVDGKYKTHSFGCIESGDSEWIKSAKDYKERFFDFAGIHINNQSDADLIACLCENELSNYDSWCRELFSLCKYARVYKIKVWFDYFVDGETPEYALINERMLRPS